MGVGFDWNQCNDQHLRFAWDGCNEADRRFAWGECAGRPLCFRCNHPFASAATNPNT